MAKWLAVIGQVLMALVWAAPAGASPLTRLDMTLRGGLVATGNTLGLAGTTAGPSTNDGIGVFTDAALVLQVAGWPLGTTDDWTLASSDAVLDVPAGATVVYAELVWGGTVAADVAADLDTPITLVTPSGAEHEVAPDAETATPDSGSMRGAGAYARSADVTAFIEGGGTYRVGGVPAALGGSDDAAGWALYVVYAKADLAPHRIVIATIMEAAANGANPDATGQVTGLCVPSVVGDRDAHLAVSALEGDASLNGDTFRVAAKASDLNGNGARITGLGTALDNVFGGHLTRTDGTIDTRGTFGNANHDVAANIAGARQGWDVITLDATSRVDQGWGELWTRSVTNGDPYSLVAVGVSLASRTPIIDTHDALSASPTAIGTVGDIVTLTVTLHNSGDAGAALVDFALPTPEGLDYVANSLHEDGVNPASGAVSTSAALASGVRLGDLAAGATHVVTVQFRVDVLPAKMKVTFAPTAHYGNIACADAPVPEAFEPTPFEVFSVVCGDGVVTGSETCDDGNERELDGCSAHCATERGWICPSAGGTCTATCGDGVRAIGAEICDDGNTRGADGCSPSCTLEPGFDCVHSAVDGDPQPDSLCASTCGDGRLAVPIEACDDGNKALRDGCNSACQVEVGWECSDEVGVLSVCAAICGDGQVVGPEACDDGHGGASEAPINPGAPPDGCAADCSAVDHGWHCLGTPSVCVTTCGDGVIADGVEVCDDGNHAPADGCAANCKSVEDGFTCGDPPAEPSVCTRFCGDGKPGEGELCDDGNGVGGDGCSATCAPETGWVCTDATNAAPSVCQHDRDGDSIPDDGDHSGDPFDAPCAEGQTSGCDDNCPDFANADQTFPTGAAATYLCPPYLGPRTQGGGGGCGAGGLAWPLGLAGVALFWVGRRRRATLAATAQLAATAAMAAGVQLPSARAQSVDPQLFQAALAPSGILSVDTTTTNGHLQPWFSLLAHLANDELVTRVAADTTTHGPLRDRVVLTAAVGLGILDMLDVAVGLPLMTTTLGAAGSQTGEAGVGDLRLSARGRLFRTGSEHGLGDGFGLALAADLTFPTGSHAPFMSDHGVTVTPKLVLDFRTTSGFVVAANIGYHIRPRAVVDDLTIDHEVRLSLGAELPIVYGVALTAEVNASLGLGDSADDDGSIAARELPVEALGGLRWRSPEGIVLSAAAGSGLTEGYGAPDFRVFVGFSINAKAPAAYAEPLVPVAKNVRHDDWDDVPEKVAKSDATHEKVTPEAFDQLAAKDPDTDADGISAPVDQCPTVPEDVDDWEDGDGCPDFDNDGDGVLDGADKCPNAGETINGNADDDGCPDEGESLVKQVGPQLEIADKIQFKENSAELLPSDDNILDQIAAVLKAHPDITRMRIEGHTDNQGDREFNVDLAERRAGAVRAYLVEHGGIARERLFAKGFGSTRPIANNNTEAGRAKNRRVEFHVVPPGQPFEGEVQ